METFLVFVTEHWLLWSAFVLVLITTIAYELRTLVRGNGKLTPMQATQLMNQQQAVVIDIRDRVAFDKGHIIGAKHLGKSQVANNHNQLKQWTKDVNPLIVVCELGQFSLSIARQLSKAGFESVYTLGGGLQAWRSASLPLVKK